MVDRLGVNMRERTCADCGTDISGTHGNVARCRVCAVVRAKQQQAHGRRIGRCAVESDDCLTTGRLRNGYCERHYRRLQKYGTTEPPPRTDQYKRYVIDEAGCWNWAGPMYKNGYGHMPFTQSGHRLAHRAYFEHYARPIPDGTVLDHLCRNRRCVNPAHLEPVTHAENLRRGREARMGNLCGRGHDQTLPGARWTEPSTGRSYCRKCKAIREKEGRERRRAG